MTHARILTGTAALAAAALLATAGCSDVDDNPVAAKVGMAAAETWLARVDRDSLGVAWEVAAPDLHDRRDRQQWIDAVSSARAELGQIVDRRPVAERYADELHSFGQGAFVVATFRSEFTRRKDVEEIVIMRLVDGTWRADRYIIDPQPS